MGVLLVMFLFRNRHFQCSYFPNGRVLEDLRSKHRVIPREIQEQMHANAIDTGDISLMLLTGDVDFKKSDTEKGESCHTYWIDYKPQKKTTSFSAEWQDCDSTATILRLMNIEKK